MPVLITAAASAESHRLQRTLELSDVIFADEQNLPAALFGKTRFIQIPSGGSFSFSHQLLSLCLDYAIEIVFPLRKTEVLALAEAKTLFEEYNIQVIVPEIAELAALLSTASSLGDEIVVAKDGMILSGQFLEQNELPAATGLFICPAEDYSELKLFIVD